MVSPSLHCLACVVLWLTADALCLHSMLYRAQDAVVEWSRVRQSLDIDAGTAKEYLIAFFEMDSDRDGKLSLEVKQPSWCLSRASIVAEAVVYVTCPSVLTWRVRS